MLLRSSTLAVEKDKYTNQMGEGTLCFILEFELLSPIHIANSIPIHDKTLRRPE